MSTTGWQGASGLFVDSLDGGWVTEMLEIEWMGGNWQSEAVHRVNIDGLGGVGVCSDV